jgi:hypothetical protein
MINKGNKAGLSFVILMILLEKLLFPHTIKRFNIARVEKYLKDMGVKK